jgi:hypothetical protein
MLHAGNRCPKNRIFRIKVISKNSMQTDTGFFNDDARHFENYHREYSFLYVQKELNVVCVDNMERQHPPTPYFL